MKHLLTAVLAVVAGSGIQNTNDEVAIYSLALHAVVSSAGREPVALADTTMELASGLGRSAQAASQAPAEYVRAMAPFTHPETAAGFLRATAEQRKLPQANFKGFRVVDAGRLRQAGETARWQEFARLNGVRPMMSVRVSAIGFNTARTEALVYVSVDCVGLCGATYIMGLGKSTSGWQVTETRLLQES